MLIEKVEREINSGRCPMPKILNDKVIKCCKGCDYYRAHLTLKWCAIKDGDKVSEITDPITILPDCPLPEFKEDDDEKKNSL